MSGSNSSSPGAGVPPEPLAFSVHGLSGPDLADPEQARRRRTLGGRVKMLLLLLVCAAPVIASYFTYYVVRPQARTNYATLIQPSRSLPPLALQDLDGKPVVAATLQGQWLLLVLGPAHCADACEQRLYMQRQLREMLGREKDRLDKLWLVTDAAEVPATLRASLQAGSPADVTILRADRGALAQWLQPAAGQALEDHLYLVDPMGEWMMRVPVPPDPMRLKRDLERLLRASASWDRPGR